MPLGLLNDIGWDSKSYFKKRGYAKIFIHLIISKFE
jgi:hypothetical protein